MFCTILRERRRRELRPALAVLKECAERTKEIKGADANAYGKCVAQAAQAASNASTQATVAAAKACKAERAANKTAFASTYKSFGACVSQKSKAK